MHEILKETIQHITELQGISCEVLSQDIARGENRVDALIMVRYQEWEARFYVDIMRKVVPEQVFKMSEEYENDDSKIILAEYITPKAKELLRNRQISYVDTVGNMFLVGKHIYVYVQSTKTSREKIEARTRAFNKAGLKVIFQFLKEPAYLNAPYRFIAEKARVTISTVGKVIHSLLREKYISRKNANTFVFNDRNKLFEEWVAAYSKRLKPKLKQVKCKWIEKNTNWRNTNLPIDTYWGGIAAAEKLTDYVLADRVDLYTGLEFSAVMRAIKLVPDRNGEVTLFEKFWENEELSDLPDPLLIYADLMEEASPRYLEVASKIYKGYVENRL